MTAIEAAAFARLNTALSAVADALRLSDATSLLAAEPELASALDGLARVRPLRVDPDMRAAIADTRAALVRCRRLGASLTDFSRIALDPLNEAGYSRRGLAGPAGAPAPAGVTLEARG